MELGEVRGLEVAGLHQRAGQGVAQGEGGRRRRRRGEPEGAGLVRHAGIEVGRGVARKERFGVAAHADDGDVLLHQVGQETQELVGLPRVRDGEHHVGGRDDAEVAVESIERVDEKARRAGRREGGGDLGADVTALPHPGHDEFALADEDDFHGAVKIGIKPGDEVEERLRFVLQAFYGSVSPFTHNREVITFSSWSRGSMLGPSLSAWSGSGWVSKK